MFGLLLGGFSGGDNADHITPPFGVHDHANQHFDPANADPALFVVVHSGEKGDRFIFLTLS